MSRDIFSRANTNMSVTLGLQDQFLECTEVFTLSVRGQCLLPYIIL